MKLNLSIAVILLLSSTYALSLDKDHHKKDKSSKKIDSEVDKILKEAEGIQDLQAKKKGEAQSDVMSEVSAVVKDLEKKEDAGSSKANIAAVIEEVK